MPILPPSVDYAEKDFDALRQRLIALIGSAFPDWSDFSVASFGNVLLEMYAFVGDVLGYYLPLRPQRGGRQGARAPLLARRLVHARRREPRRVPSPPELAPVQRATRRAVAAPCPALAKRLTCVQRQRNLGLPAHTSRPLAPSRRALLRHGRLDKVPVPAERLRDALRREDRDDRECSPRRRRRARQARTQARRRDRERRHRLGCC